MGPSRGEGAVTARVKIEVQADLEIDLLDYVPLAERRKVFRPGTRTLDGGLAVKHLSPQLLKDAFVRDLALVMKPMSSLFPQDRADAYNSGNVQISHDQTYSVVVTEGKQAEVFVVSTAVNPFLLGNCSQHLGKERDASKCCNPLHASSGSVGSEVFGCDVVEKTLDRKMESTDGPSSNPNSNFFIKLMLEPALCNAVALSSEALCTTNMSMEDTPRKLGSDVNHFVLTKKRRMGGPGSHFIHHSDKHTEFSHTGNICSQKSNQGAQPQDDDCEIVNNFPNDRTLREDIGLVQGVSGNALRPSSSGGFLNISQISPSECHRSIPCIAQGHAESNIASSHLVSTESVLWQAEVCPDGDGQILEPLPLTNEDGMEEELMTECADNEFLEGTNLRCIRSSLDSSSTQVQSDGSHFHNRCYGFSTPHENQELNVTSSNQTSIAGINVPVTTVYDQPSVTGDLQKEVKLEPYESSAEPCPSDGKGYAQLCTPSSAFPERIIAEDDPTTAQHVSSNGGYLDVSCKNLTSQESIVVDKSLHQPIVSEVKAAVLGKKRVQFLSDHSISCSSFSTSSTTTVKNEPVDECYVEGPQVNSAKCLSLLGSIFFEETAGTAFCSSNIYPEVGNHQERIPSPGFGEHPPVPVMEHNKTCLISKESVTCLSSLPTSSFTIKTEAFNRHPLGIVPENQGSQSCGSAFPLSLKAGPLEILREKVKMEAFVEDSDVLDHISLQERMKILVSSILSKPSICINPIRSERTASDGLSSALTSSNTTHKRRKQRTATDSVETALEEDAPGLLQVLVDSGIKLEEIKLYEGVGEDDNLDLFTSKDSFGEFENVIVKLFSERPSSLFKLGSLRDERGSKTAYCLACLVSLIEQTQYMQLRNCPVEWGWCRDLLSFIFVFEKHNRIVLERPEYGFATYFFELVESLPIAWQVKRLVTAMKLTKCSRITLIENKSLVVGEDLSEGEARVLEEYGWRPNTGLGSLLNFCERVVHDNRKEMNNSEWRTKIGKLLINGHDSGRTVVPDLPKKVVEYISIQEKQIKLET